MKNIYGFTFLELIIFIIILSLAISTLFLVFTTAVQRVPLIYQQNIASQLAQQCMEWFIGQRRMSGYSTLVCPSTPTFCPTVAGYTVSTAITCTTLNSDSNYKTITVTVSGLGDTVLSTLIADY